MPALRSAVTVNMRVLSLLWLLVVIQVALGMDDGEPGCQTLQEVHGVYRNFNDPTKYWYCAALNAKAQLLRCGPTTAFSQQYKSCIPWIYWVWEPTVDPPSRPDGYQSLEPKKKR